MLCRCLTVKASSSAVAERPRDASCLSVVSYEYRGLFILIHFALSDPITHPMTSSLTSSEIPITQPPTLTSSWTLGARVRVRVRVRARGLGLRERGVGLSASPPKPNVSACAARPFHDVCLRHH